jgi:hypothetical protein
VKVDTDRHLGPERNRVRVAGEPVVYIKAQEGNGQLGEVAPA